MSMPATVRNLALRLISLSMLGPRGWGVHRRLILHPPGEFISDEIRRSRTHYELINLARVWLELRPKFVVDIGANLGNHSNFFNIKGSEVIAFEPIDANFELLCRNLFRGSRHQLALGSECAFGEFVVDLTSLGDSHLKGSIVLGDESGFRTQTVEIKTLDSFQLERADLIKIDVEGLELEVLKSAQDTLSRLRPTLWLELHSNARLRKLGTKYSREELVGWLAHLGYHQVRELDSSNYLFGLLPSQKGE